MQSLSVQGAALGGVPSKFFGHSVAVSSASGKAKSGVVCSASVPGSRSVDVPRNVAAKVSVEAPPTPAALDESRLVPKVEERQGYWVLKEEYREKINPAEKIKIAKEPMKFFKQMEELEKLASVGMEELDKDKETKDDIDTRLKWLGFFHRRKHQYGRFMMRLKLPNGITNSDQVRYLASVVEKYGSDGCADVTTRQNWQIRGVVLEDAAPVLRGLQSVGLTSIQSGMDNVRNAVGNPIAGIDPDEILDTRPYLDALNQFITGNGKGNTSITNLPRKWNVCVVGTHDLFEHPHINDLAYIPAMKNGVRGFNVLVGGFFSNKRCAEAIPCDAWVSDEDVVPCCKAVLEAYRDLGARDNRQKARMMWLIDELGMDTFRAEVEKRLPSGVLERAGEDLVNPKWQRRSLFGVHPQNQPGLNFVGMKLPVGRLQAPEMYELARLADEYGSGELRLTVEQNIILINVPDAKVVTLLEEPLLQKFSVTPGVFAAGTVACTGSQFCGQAIIETKANALKVADIGFMGCTARDENKKPTEGVDIFFGGRIGSDSHLGDLIKSKVPISGLLPVVQDLLVEHFGATRKA